MPASHKLYNEVNMKLTSMFSLQVFFNINTRCSKYAALSKLRPFYSTFLGILLGMFKWCWATPDRPDLSFTSGQSKGSFISSVSNLAPVHRRVQPVQGQRGLQPLSSIDSETQNVCLTNVTELALLASFILFDFGPQNLNSLSSRY